MPITNNTDLADLEKQLMAWAASRAAGDTIKNPIFCGYAKAMVETVRQLGFPTRKRTSSDAIPEDRRLVDTPLDVDDFMGILSDCLGPTIGQTRDVIQQLWGPRQV